MVFHRLCDSESKLGVLRWLETGSLPEVDTVAMTVSLISRNNLPGRQQNFIPNFEWRGVTPLAALTAGGALARQDADTPFTPQTPTRTAV